MSPYLKIFLVVLVLHLSASQSYAQLTDEQKIEEVYGLHFFDDRPEIKVFFLRLLQNRIQYVEMRQQPDEKYPLLESVPLLNKFNPNLVHDAVFDPNIFNPIKYQMDFYAKSTMVYRIDADNIIVITPQ